MKPDGTALVNDSDLTVIDQSFFAQARVASAVNEVIDIPTDYGGSYVGSMDEDTNSGISRVLYIDRLINPNSVAVGTVVTVKWSDGTTAKFIRTTAIGSIQWQYVPGSARDAQGRPITHAGSLIQNPNAGSGGTGSGSVNPVVSDPNGLYPWYLYINGGPDCTSNIGVSFPDGETIDFQSFGPC